MESSTLGCACLGILVLSSRTLNMDCVLISLLALLILALVGLEIEAAQETRTEDPAPDDAPDRDAGPGHGTPIAPATYGGFHQMPAQPIIISRMTVQSGTALRETYSSKDLSGPVLTESVMLALAGGGLGILLRDGRSFHLQIVITVLHARPGADLDRLAGCRGCCGAGAHHRPSVRYRAGAERVPDRSRPIHPDGQPAVYHGNPDAAPRRAHRV